VVLAVSIFGLFRWLFGIGLPGAALQFATGTTVLIMGGLLSGRYASRLWFKANNKTVNQILAISSALAFLSLFMIGFFITKMIERTQFNYFFFTIITLFLACGFVSIIITLLRFRIKNKLLTAHSALAHSKTELQLLQSQLSPHFLFNTLNNLYGLSILDHQKVPALLLKLSELLRYSVYEAKEVFVPLTDEVNYLKNYIEFEKIRLGDRLSLTAQFPGVRIML
jgi:sensor histidine kinase YesM